MSKNKLTIKANSLEESLARFKNAWELVEKGEQVDAPIEILSFENTSMLMKTLSPKRLDLLQTLHILGTVSIRTLAKELDRDYSNVHQDIKSLAQIGVVLKKEGKYYVPWKTIVTEFSLCTEKSPRHSHRKHDSTAA